MDRGVLVIISGFSGAGKGTVTKELCGSRENPKGNYRLSISATTRNPRPGEEDGVAYFFRTREEFEQMIKEDALIEWAEYVGNYYGTPKAYVEEQLCAGKNVILEIEVKGALQVKEKYPEAALIFLTTKDAETLEERLRGRGTESEDVIAGRLRRASEEAGLMNCYDYIVVNDQLEDCVREIDGIIRCEGRKSRNQQQLIEGLKKDLLDRFA